MSPGPGTLRQADDPQKAAPIPLKPTPQILSTPGPQNTLLQPAGNQATQRSLATSYGSDAMNAFLPDLEQEYRDTRSSLSKLGPPGPTGGKVEGRVTSSGPRQAHTLQFVNAAMGQGSLGSIESVTEVSFHYDPGDPTVTVLGKTLPGSTVQQDPLSSEFDWVRAEASNVAAYPVWIEYRRTIFFRDAEGRYCEVKVAARVDVSHEAFARSITGKRPSMVALMSVGGEKASLSIDLEGRGPVQPYYGSYFAAQGQSIEMMTTMAANLFAVLNGLSEDVHPGSAGFVIPDMNAGDQFEQLERFLKSADEMEVKRRGPTQVLTSSTSGGEYDDDDDDDEAEPLSPVARGIIAGVLGFLAGLALVLGGAAILWLAIPTLTFMGALGIVGGAFLAVQFLRSLLRRAQEAKGPDTATPSGVLVAAILDALGISSVIEAATDRSILTDEDLNRSIEERWESGTTGLLGLFAFLLGARGLKSRGPAAGMDLPTGVDLPTGIDVPPRLQSPAAVDTPPAVIDAQPARNPVTNLDPWAGTGQPASPAPPGPATASPVDASAFSTPEQYLNGLRNSPSPSVAGPGWDHTRFPNGPRARWRPGDPVDMPDADSTYPTFNTARGRFWRNRAQQEIDARARGASRQNIFSADPIQALSDADLANLRDTATSDVRAPRDPSTGRAAEIEHFGAPQRVGRWLKRAGFTASEARRLSDAANPANLLDVSSVEHAFFDAEAHGFGRLRADVNGRMWADTQWADPRVGRPLIFMSDAALLEIASRARTDPAINLQDVPGLLAAVRAELATRGLSVGSL